jgi:perosamine synthetase
MIKWAEPDISEIEINYINQAIQSGWISGGPFIEELEKQLANILKCKYAILTSNGTTAIHLAFIGLGLKPGDEIIIPSFGYHAATNIANLMGLNVRFCDVDLSTYCISASKFEEMIGEKTKVLVLIHTYGNVGNLDKILKVCKEKNISVIEDAAEAFGVKYHDNYVGTIGTIGTFSFHASKSITTGEGGLVVTNDDNLAERLLLFRSHGVKENKYYHLVPGHNFRLTNLQAAMGLAQLKRIEYFLQKRNKIFNYYKSKLKNFQKIILPSFSENIEPLPWTYPIRLKNYEEDQRDKLIDFFSHHGIETRRAFYCAEELPYIKTKDTFSNSIMLSRSVLSLPIHTSISIADLDKICDTLKKFFLK